MKKSLEQTKSEIAERRNSKQLERLRTHLSRKYWTVGEAALYLIGVDTVDDHNDDQDYRLSFLPGRNDTEWLLSDSTHDQRHFDECFEHNFRNAKNILAMVSDKKTDRPLNWIFNYQSEMEIIPWFDIAKNDILCAKLLSAVEGNSQVNETVINKRKVSPYEKGGHEKAKGSVSSFVRIEIEKLLKRWHDQPQLYPDCRSFKRDMKDKFIEQQASPDPEDFPDKTKVHVRSPKVVTRLVNDLIAIHNIPKGMVR